MSTDLDHRLAQCFDNMACAGVYYSPRSEHDVVMATARAAGCLVLQVNLAAARDKDALLAIIAKALRFPEWFGSNWDALNDCLLDMAWLPAPGYALFFEHCDAIHARAGDDFLLLRQLLADATEAWREKGIPFWSLIDIPASDIADLTTLTEPGAA